MKYIFKKNKFSTKISGSYQWICKRIFFSADFLFVSLQEEVRRDRQKLEKEKERERMVIEHERTSIEEERKELEKKEVSFRTL